MFPNCNLLPLSTWNILQLSASQAWNLEFKLHQPHGNLSFGKTLSGSKIKRSHQERLNQSRSRVTKVLVYALWIKRQHDNREFSNVVRKSNMCIKFEGGHKQHNGKTKNNVSSQKDGMRYRSDEPAERGSVKDVSYNFYFPLKCLRYRIFVFKYNAVTEVLFKAI